MGGRGAIGNDGIKILSYEKLTDKQKDVEFHLKFEKGIEVFEKGYLNKTVKYSKFDWSKVDEAVIDVYTGEFKRRKKQLEEKGFKILAQTKIEKDAPVYAKVKLHVKK